MPLYIAKCGDLDRCYRCLTDSQSKDSATQLLTKYKSGALVTQLISNINIIMNKTKNNISMNINRRSTTCWALGHPSHKTQQRRERKISSTGFWRLFNSAYLIFVNFGAPIFF